MFEVESGLKPNDQSLPALYLVVADTQLLCDQHQKLLWLDQASFEQLRLREVGRHYLGRLAHYPCYAVEASLQDLPPDYCWCGLRSQLAAIPEDHFAAAGRALQILQFHRDHQFCGRCGQATLEGQSERMRECRRCQTVYYPRISPCIITLVTRGDQCLLARHARSSKPVFSALAGFIESGETPEQTVVREVKEEVAITVTDCRYLKSQSWPFPSQLMLGFISSYQSGEIDVDQVEIVEANWYRYDQLPEIPPLGTISHALIEEFVANQQLLAFQQSARLKGGNNK